LLADENNALCLQDHSTNGTAYQEVGANDVVAVGHARLSLPAADISLFIPNATTKVVLLVEKNLEAPPTDALPSDAPPNVPDDKPELLSALTKIVGDAVTSGVAGALATVTNETAKLREDFDVQEECVKSHGDMIVAQAKELYRLGGEMEAMKTQLSQQQPPTCNVFLFKANIYVCGGTPVLWKETRGLHVRYITAGSNHSLAGWPMVNLSHTRDGALAGRSDILSIWTGHLRPTKRSQPY